MNNEEIRPTTNLIVSKCSAYDYINNSNPNLEKLTTQYYETFSITGRFTGYFSNITIGDFYNDLSYQYSDPVAILGGLTSTARKEASKQSTESSGSGSSSSGSSSGSGGSSDSSSGSNNSSGSSSSESSSQTTNNTDTSKISEGANIITVPENLTAGTSSIVGKRGTENLGIAVFNSDKYCGELTVTETICHLLINNNIDSCIISLDNSIISNEEKNNEEKIELQLFPVKKSKINLDIKDDTPYITIKLSLDADIMTLNKDINYATNETLSKISDEAKKYLEEQFDNYLNKVSKVYNIDIDNFCTKGPAHFATISEWKNFNWDEKYKNTEFDVQIDINVISSMLLTKT